MPEPKIPISNKEIAAFCNKWRIVEFSLFGSVLREDFGPDSDVDVMVSFDPKAEWSLFDLVVMKEELAAIFGREVDLVEKEALRNPHRRREIMAHHEVVHVGA